MKPINRRTLLITSLIAISLSAIGPFFIACRNDSFISILPVSLAGIGTVTGLITMYIAIILYQKFGLESRFIERKTDKVLELVDLLKGKHYTIHTDQFKYFVRFGIDDLKRINKQHYYQYMKDMVIAVDFNDFDSGTKQIRNLRNSYWLPNEIKSKLDFLDVNITFAKNENTQYANLSFNSQSNDPKEWVAYEPRLTVADFLKLKNDLSIEITNWLSDHCDIKLDLNLSEPNEEVQN